MPQPKNAHMTHRYLRRRAFLRAGARLQGEDRTRLAAIMERRARKRVLTAR